MTGKPLDEISLINFSRRELASDQTVKFSKERQSFEGGAPKSTKFISMDIDEGRDYVTFNFLTSATEKYEDDHEYKDTNPDANFRLERDPSALYEIQLRFFGVLKVKNMRPRKLDGVKNWLWATDFAIWSNDPSFHWQGHNYNLSRLGASIHPTNIAPTSKHINPATGKMVMGWKDVHQGSFLSKHLFDLFLHIKFFINVMAGALMNKLGSNKPLQMRPNQFNTSPDPKRDITGKKYPHLPQEEPQEPVEEPVEDIPTQEPETPPEGQEMASEGEDEGEQGGVDAEITKPKEESRRRTMTKRTYRWKESTFGLTAHFTERDKPYRVLFESGTELLANTLMDYDEDFKFEGFDLLSWKERVSLHPSVLQLKEVSVMFDYGLSQERVTPSALAILNTALREYILNEGANFDILGISTSPQVSETHAKLTNRVIEEALSFFPNKVQVVFDDNNSGVVRHFLMDSELRTDLFGRGRMIEAEGGQSVVVAYGTFTPPTKDHIRLLQKVVASAKETGSANLLFIQADKDFAGDAGSLKQKTGMLRKIPELRELNVCADPGVHTFYDAMMYLYTDLHYKTVSLICGSDQVQEMEAFFTKNNGRKTEQGYFKFDQFKVVSFGAPNPDKSDSAVQARNALVDKDFEAYIKASQIPYFGQMKNLFNVLRYELKGSIGV